MDKFAASLVGVGALTTRKNVEISIVDGCKNSKCIETGRRGCRPLPDGAYLCETVAMFTKLWYNKEKKGGEINEIQERTRAEQKIENTH